MDFIIGSNAFFKGFPDFNPKDADILSIQNHQLPNNVLNAKLGNQDVFFWSPLTKEEFIQDTLTCGVPMRAGKFLVPEFAKYLNLTIDDLKRLRECFDNIDDKHLYEKIIYDAYLQNDDFVLTKEQLESAYKEYKNKKSTITIK